MSDQSYEPNLATNTERSSEKQHRGRDNHDSCFSEDRPDITSVNQREENRFTLYRDIASDYAREFLGTMILCILGIGANCQVTLSNASSLGTPAGNYTSLSLAWGAGIALGVRISNGPRAHINPAVTLALATWRGFPWMKVPYYILAQLLGAIVGGAIVYGNYFHAISVVEGGSDVRTMKTAVLFGTFPLSFMSDVSAFFSEFLGSAMLLLGILIFTDQRNGVPGYLVPVGLFITLYSIGAALGYETSFALNPARDFGPRVVTGMVGYGGQVFTTRSHYWLWSPIIACILGAQVATFCTTF